MYIILIFFSAAVYDPNVHSFYDEPLPYAERYHKYTDFKEHKPSYRDGECNIWTSLHVIFADVC